MLQVSKKRLASAKNYRMIKKRKGLQLIDALIEEKLLTEETECLLRAQFSGMFPNDLCNTYCTAPNFYEISLHFYFVLPMKICL